MYIVDPETAIIEKVVKKPETEKEKKELLKEIEFHARWVHEKEELIKKISKSYEKGGLVLEGMWILQKYLTTNQ